MPDEEPSGWSPKALTAAISPDVKRAIVYCLKVGILMRVALGVIAVIAVGTITAIQPEGQTVVHPGFGNFFAGFERWDAGNFTRIAAEGYTVGDPIAAFFPVFPLLIRILSPLFGGSEFAAATFIVHAAFFGALVCLYLLTKLDFDEDLARRTVMVAAFFPTAFFFISPFTESLFMLLAIACIWAARRNRWGWAAIFGGLASGTRSIGLVLILVLVAEWFVQRREGHGGEGWWRSWAWPLLCAAFVASGTVAYMAYWLITQGDAMIPFSSQAGWFRTFTAPWTTLVDGTRQAFDSVKFGNGGFLLIDWLVSLIALAGCLWTVLRTRPPYFVYTWFSLLIPLLFVWPGRYLMSYPRFVIVVFPIYWAIAWVGRRFQIHETLVGISAAALGLFTALFATSYHIY